MTTIRDLKQKLENIWGMEKVEIIPIGKGCYLLGNMNSGSIMMSKGPIALKLEVFRVS